MTNNFNPNKNINPRHHNHHLSSSASTITTTRSNSTTQACAACRYQRRKCAPDCILAPYFPHDRQRQFQNAHKLFGVSNITKIIRDLDPPQKDEAMRTIIYQSDVRAQDPVGGCYRIIRELQRQIEYSRAELEFVLHQLAVCRAHAMQNQSQNQNHNQNHQILLDEVAIDDPNLYDDPSIVLDNNNNNDNDNYQHQGLDLDLGQMPQNELHDHNQFILGEEDLKDDNCQEEHALQLQELNSWATVNNSPSSSAVCLDEKPSVGESDDFKPINEIPPGDHRHEFKFEFEEINEPSDETLFNEGDQKALTKEENVTFFTKEDNVSAYQQHNEDHDLKTAATLFTLTNCGTY